MFHQTIYCTKVLNMYISLHFKTIITEPNDESAANVDAAKTWRDNREKFMEIAHRTVKQSLGL